MADPNVVDVYFNHYIDDSDFHFSRHASGLTHWKSNEIKLSLDVRKVQPIKEFKGIEEFPMLGISSSDSLPELYKEYKMEKNDRIFCIDMR